MENSKFQFKGFNITRSLIEVNEKQKLSKISIEFEPKGFLNKKSNTFDLHLGIKIQDDNKSFKIEVQAVAFYEFESEIAISSPSSLFYVNAPAILFPYIRAYISTLTNLSGFPPINLPTLNLTSLGKDIESKTSEIELSEK